MSNDRGQLESGTERRCTTCGKSVDQLPLEYWMFFTCRSCAAENPPRRWGDTGTYRKWRYFPRWHMLQHPDRPARVRNRHPEVA